MLGAACGVPYYIPGTLLRRDGAVAPSERIILGGLGIGDRGQHDLGVFMKEKVVQFIAIADTRESQRRDIKNMADQFYGNNDCVMYQNMFELLERPDIDAVLIATGDSGRMAVSSDALRSELKFFGTPGTDPDNHIREFLECCKTRRNPASNADVAAWAHIASHCGYIAWQLGRKVTFDPAMESFINDEEANRMRARTLREPWTF